MLTIKAYYDNGDMIQTDFNGAADDVIRHYLGNKHVFDYGEREEMALCTFVEICGGETADIWQEHARLEGGKRWYYINGDTGYNMDRWTCEKARADYVTEEAAIARDIATRAAWGFYD